MASSSSARAHRAPMPVGPSILCDEKATKSASQALHVDRHLRDGLARVDEHVGAGGPGRGHQERDVDDGADDVRHRGDGEQRRAVEEAVEVGEVEALIGGERDPAELDAALGGEDVPRHDVGVVLEVAEHDGVAGLQVGACPRVRDEVDRLGGVAREHDLARSRARRRTRRPCRGRLRTRRWLPRRSCTRRGARWRTTRGRRGPSRRAPTAGFWADDAESRYTSRLPLTWRFRIGKSAWMRATSRGVVESLMPPPPRRRASKPSASSRVGDLGTAARPRSRPSSSTCTRSGVRWSRMRW